MTDNSIYHSISDTVDLKALGTSTNCFNLAYEAIYRIWADNQLTLYIFRSVYSGQAFQFF